MVRQVSALWSKQGSALSALSVARLQRRVGLKTVVVVLSSAVLLNSAPAVLSQTSFNPGAASPATGAATPVSGATSATGSTLSGATSALSGLTGGSGGAGGIQGQIEQIQSFVGGYLKQFEDLKGQIQGVVEGYVGAVGKDVSDALKNALGDLNLPDPSKLLDGLKRKDANGNEKPTDAALNNVSGVLPSVLKRNATASVLADLWGQASFSTDAQKAVKEDLQNIDKQVKGAQQVVSASNNLSNQSTQAASQSSQSASTANTQAQQAQKRVSTQDAIKDLNLTAATLSTQLSGQSQQLASQSGQLSNLTSLGATSVALQGDASAKLSQVNLGVAAAVTQLSDMNSQLHGAEQLRIIQENSLVDKATDASAKAFHLLR